MDVFGTVISSIQLVNKLIGYLQAVRKANEDCLRLLSEVSALGTLLDVLRCRLDKGSTGSNDGVSDQLVKVGIKGPLDQCYRAMEPIVAELERTALKANAGKPSLLAENMRRFRWPFRQGEIGAILGGIERLKSLISLALQTSLIEFIDKARNELAVVGLNVEKIEAAVSALEADQRVHTKKAESLHINLRALGFELQDAAKGISNIGNMVATIDRNQQDQMMKGNLMQADLTVVKEAMYGQELQETLRWLSPLDFSGQHSTAFGKCAPGTGEWFLEHPTFAAWRRGEASILWCPGNPGVGKSVMASIVTHRLREQISEDVAVVSVYFEYTTKYTAAQIAEVILKQLVRRRITQSGINSLRRHMAADRPTVEELWTILEAEVRTYARVFIVIDALDEADIQVWAPLLGRLRALSGISLLATSRNTGEVEFELRPYQRLDIMANEGDMRKYIDGRLLDSTGTLKRLLKENAPLREEIIAGIMKKADGMFLLAQLHMNSLETKARVTDLRQALTRLPGDLKNTYDDTLGRISDEDKPLAYQIFSWLIHATRPMTIRDLQYALAVKEGMAAIDADDLYDEGHLTSICVGLVVLQDSENTSPHSRGAPVGLVHYTTQEYLRDYISPHLPHPTHLAITCLQYFSFDIFRIERPLSREPEEPLTQMPLAEYAIYSWGEHARMYCDDKTIQGLAMELLRDPPRVVTIGSLPCGAIDLSAIHLCARFGLKRYLEYVLDDGFDLNSKDSNGDTAITYTARNGWEEIARLLLGREGIDIDPKGRNGATPLIQAAMHGHQGIVALLLARDDVGGNWQGENGGSSMTHAAQRKHGAVAERLLMKSGANLNSQDQNGLTPLAWATYAGHEAIVRMLLGRVDLDINTHNHLWFNTPLALAIIQGDESEPIVRALLERDDLDVNVCNDDGDTPLAQAVTGGHEAIVRALLGRTDLDVNSTHKEFQDTPVIKAVRSKHWGVLELLLARHDVDLNSRGLYGYRALTVAVLGGHEDIVRLLLARDDLDVNVREICGSTPIIYAARGGHDGILRQLLARGDVDINSQGQHGHTALITAVCWGHEAIVQLLLARDDLNVNLRGDFGGLAITYAARKGRDDIIGLMLARDDVDINIRDQDGRTPLACAVRRGHEAIVRLLLTRNELSVNPRDNVGNTPVIDAARKGRDGVLKLLLARVDIDINLRGRYGYTALAFAILEGHEAAVQLLLARDDLDTSLKDSIGDTYLAIAAYRGNEGVIKFLLAKGGVDINSRNFGGLVALSYAAWEGHDAIVKVLLNQDGIDVNWVDPDGNTSLDYAEEHNDEGIIKLLRAAGGHTGVELRGKLRALGGI